MTNTAIIMGYLYATKSEAIIEIKKRLEKRANKIAGEKGATLNIAYEDMYIPTINTENETQLIHEISRKVLGQNNVEVFPETIMASEDFSEYLKRVPGYFFFVGNGEKSQQVHTAKYDFNDDAILTATKLMAEVAINYLNLHTFYRTAIYTKVTSSDPAC